MFSEVHKRVKKTGSPPGVATYTGDRHSKPVINVTTYSSQYFNEQSNASLTDCMVEPKDNETIWINVEGLSDVEVIRAITEKFNVHPLTLEDVLNVEQRPKVEEFDTYIYVTLKVIIWNSKLESFIIQQISIVFGKNFILSFHEIDTNLFDSIRDKMRSNSNHNARRHGPDYLMYRMIDSIVDEYFVVMEGLGDQLEKLEDLIVVNPTSQNAQQIYKLKREVLILRKSIWPMREAINHLMHADNELISKFTLIYLRDVYDHTIQGIDSLETFRDMLSGMLDMYLSGLTNRMNEIMKTLTIITTIFIPITAIASVYGMNFDYMPGVHWWYGYPIVLTIMFAISILMIFYFYRKKWL